MKVRVLVLYSVIGASLCGTLHGGHSSEQSDAIKEIRSFVKSNREKFDPLDVENVLHGADWHVTRYFDYLGDTATVPDVKKLMDETLQWRASIKLNSWVPEDFPCEFWLAGYLQLTHDRQGEPVLATDPRALGSYSGDLRTTWYTFHQFQFEYVDKMAANNGTAWKFLLNLEGVQLSNFADISGMISAYAKGTDRFPGFFRGIFVMEMPPLMETAMRMVISMFSAKTSDAFHYMQSRERYFIVKKRDMPEHFGGRLPVSKGLVMVQFPKLLTDCVPLREMARWKGWSDQSVKEFLDNTKHIIDYNAQQLNISKLL